jgi:drug/metabolite transporter (DMT)-like permease
MTTLTPRFIIAGAVLVVAGTAIAVTREGVGPDAPWIGGLVAAIGAGLIATGLMRHWNRPD